MVRRITPATKSDVKASDAGVIDVASSKPEKSGAAKAAKKPRKKNRRKQVESQIRHLRRSTKPMLPLSFIREFFNKEAPGMRVQRSALEALRTAVTAEAHGLFESAAAVMESSDKSTLGVRHLQAVKKVELMRPGNG
jgi:histone H3/H4